MNQVKLVINIPKTVTLVEWHACSYEVQRSGPDRPPPDVQSFQN